MDLEKITSVSTEMRLIGQLGNTENSHMNGVTVELMEHEPTNQKFVLKRARKNQARAKLRLKREAAILGSIDHEHIITLYGTNNEDDINHLALEFLPQVYDSPQNVTEDTVIQFVLAIASALTYLHEEGLAHLDVKPANIGKDYQRAIKLFDFDISRVVGNGMYLPWHIGTPGFMSPETIHERYYSQAADCYALGMTLNSLKKRNHNGGPVHVQRYKFSQNGCFVTQYDASRPFDVFITKTIGALLNPDPIQRLTAKELVAKTTTYCLEQHLSIPLT
jgi:serine/threonine protein kinase